jgi:acyl-coenzyme A synthetase/AMP-(fatty) acid ligase
LNFYF